MNGEAGPSEDEGGQRQRGYSDHSLRYKSRAVKCQVPGCKNELNQKAYYKRYRICSIHCNLPSLELKGGTVRWCQQCGRFQPLADFAGDRKTCRAKLNKHNTRRRTARSRARGADEVPEGRAGGGGAHPASSSTHSETGLPTTDCSPAQSARPQAAGCKRGGDQAEAAARQPAAAAAAAAAGWQGLVPRKVPRQEQLLPAAQDAGALLAQQQQVGPYRWLLQQQQQQQRFLPVTRSGPNEEDWRGPVAAVASAAAVQAPPAPSPPPEALPPLGQQQWAQLMGIVLPADLQPLQPAGPLATDLPPVPDAQPAGLPLAGPALDVLRSLNLSELSSQVALPPSAASHDLPSAPCRPSPSYSTGMWSTPSLGLLSNLASGSLGPLGLLGDGQLCSELLEVLRQLPGGGELTSALLAAQPQKGSSGGSASGGRGSGGGGGVDALGVAGSGHELQALASLPQWLSMSAGLLAERGSDGGSMASNMAGTQAAARGDGGRGPLHAAPSGSVPVMLLDVLLSRVGTQELARAGQGSSSGGLLPIHPLAVNARSPSAALPCLGSAATAEPTPPPPRLAAPVPAAAAAHSQPLRPVARPAAGPRSWQGGQAEELAASLWSSLMPHGQRKQQQELQQRWQQVWEAQRQGGAGPAEAKAGAEAAAEAAAAAAASAATSPFDELATVGSPSCEENNQGLESPPMREPLEEGGVGPGSGLHHPSSPPKEDEGHAAPKPSSPGILVKKELDDFLSRAALTLFNVPPEKLAPGIRNAITNLAAAAGTGGAVSEAQVDGASFRRPSSTASDI